MEDSTEIIASQGLSLDPTMFFIVLLSTLAGVAVSALIFKYILGTDKIIELLKEISEKLDRR